MNIALYHGQLNLSRNLDTLVKTIDYLNDNWIIVFLGWGPNEHTLKLLANQQNKNTFIKLSGGNWGLIANGGLQ